MLSCSNAKIISNVFSTLSCISWIFAQFPQIVYNYRHKSAKGISPHFLALWFLGDFLSFTSCLLNESVLQFQILLSAYFLMNDVILCCQYYYYNFVFQRPFGEYSTVMQPDQTSVDKPTASGILIRKTSQLPLDDLPSNSLELNGSYDSINSPILKATALASMLKTADALPIILSSDPLPVNHMGQFLAWMCAIVYMSSRIPQIYKNYTRKSVDGLSPLLFFSALTGNLLYTLSILTSCEFLVDSNGWEFLIQQLPYIMGSAGTLVFDFAYFYQKSIYKHNQPETFNLDSWDDIENHEA